MVNHLILLCSILLFTGCYQKSVIDTRMVETACPKFPVEQFGEVKEYVVTDLKVVTIDGKDYVQIPIESMTGLINQYQQVKNNYVILRSNLIEFQKGK